MRLLFIAALSGISFFFDSYFEKHPDILDELQTEKENEPCDYGTIYLFSPVGSFNARISATNLTGRKFFDQEHDRLLQKCHQHRTVQLLRAKAEVYPVAMTLMPCNLLRRCHPFSSPDDEPPVTPVA